MGHRTTLRMQLPLHPSSSSPGNCSGMQGHHHQESISATFAQGSQGGIIRTSKGTSGGSSLSLGPILPPQQRREARLVAGETPSCRSCDVSFSASINRNRMNVTSFEQNYWSLQVKMFICDRGHTAVATVTASRSHTAAATVITPQLPAASTAATAPLTRHAPRRGGTMAQNQNRNEGEISRRPR